MRRNADLVTACALAGLCLAACLLLPAGRIVPALVLLFVLPGYALLRAILPHPAFDAALRSLVAVVLSIGAVIGGGLVLDVAWRLDARTWGGLAFAVTLVASAVAAARRPVEASAGRAGPLRRPSLKISIGVGLGALALVVTVASVMAARTPLGGRDIRGYTLLGAAPSANGRTVRLTVANDEFMRRVYRLEARHAGHVIAVWGPIKLDPGQAWRGTVRRQGATLRERIVILLYLPARPHVPYRHVVLQPVNA